MGNNKNFQNIQITVEFQYLGRIIYIYSNLNETTETIFKKLQEKIQKDIKNIQFIYGGKNINSKKFLFEIINNYDKERKIMTVIAYDNSNEKSNNNKNLIMANHVVCPICKQSANIYFGNMEIKIVNCKYNHISSLLFILFFD